MVENLNVQPLDILLQGVSVWNDWRKANPLHVRLSRANLKGCELPHADMRRVDLFKANLSQANLNFANFRRTNLSQADLTNGSFNEASFDRAYLRLADLSYSSFRNANFDRANLGRTNLAAADLSGANLFGVDLSDATLQGANMSYARVGWTRFGNVDLSGVEGLDTVIHTGPSTVGIDTLFQSLGRISETFLRGCGVPDALIVQVPALVGAIEPIQFYSCFISYSSKDQDFANKLYSDLQSRGVRCWFAPEDLKIGEKFRTRIDEVIRVYDKLLLVLSVNSVSSAWVEKEVETAIEREQQLTRTMLFPVRLDDSVLEISSGWPADIRRQRHIGDFSQWKTPDAYQEGFDRLLRDLKSGAARIDD